MRLATIIEDDGLTTAAVRGERLTPIELPHHWRPTVAELAGLDVDEMRAVHQWLDDQPDRAWRPVADVRLGPAVPDPGAVYTIGLNYRDPDRPDDLGPERPLVYGKAASSVVGQDAVVTWDRGLTANVDAEVELGVVIGSEAWRVAPEAALDHVLGFTCVNDISSRDPWLDGDQWLLGKSMPGFCPVGPWIVTPDEIGSGPLRLGCTIDGAAIQAGSTAEMRFGVADIVAFLSRHVVLRPGDLIATGTPARLAAPPGPDRHLRPGDTVTVWIERIGELTTTIA